MRPRPHTKTAPAVEQRQNVSIAPLCVDLDGTLVKTDTLLEALLVLVKRRPWSVLRLPLWLAGGRAHLKRQVAARVALDAASLPYNEDVLRLLRAEGDAGRPLVLVTAADESIARAVADHLGLFQDVIATNGAENLKGRAKMQVLRERFGAAGYRYAGNHASDLAVWNGAEAAVVVGPARLAKRCRVPVTQLIERRRAGVRIVLKEMRLQHWVKNALLFVPLMMAHQVMNPALLMKASLAFLSFGFCASSVYLVNDLLDLEADRHHASKRFRPLAAGNMALGTALALVPAFLAVSIYCALQLPRMFAVTLAIYVGLTFAYSFRLKHVELIDVIVLAGLYTIRVIAGSAATGVVPSPWLLAFSTFFFFSLALIKRFSELHLARRDGQTTKVRAYYEADMELIASLGATSGYLSVLVLALYINSEQVVSLYGTPVLLWLICPLLLYWISRAWLIAHRGQMHDDPVIFALRDPVSYAVGALTAVILVVAAVLRT